MSETEAVRPPAGVSERERADVLLIGAARLYRDGLAQVLDTEEWLRVVATAQTAGEGVRACDRHRPSVVLIEIEVAGALAVAEAMSLRCWTPRVIVLGLGEDEPSPADFVACAEAGVAGYVSRSDSLSTLIDTIRNALQDELRCSPRISAALLRRVAELAQGRVDALDRSPLTVREREVLGLLDEGLSNKEIATRLGIAVTTVKHHVHHILGKLEVGSRGQAVARMRTTAPAMINSG